MTVGQLILKLKQLDPDALAVLSEADVTEPCEFVALNEILKED